MSTASSADDEIIARIRKGDETAFHDLVDRYHSSLVRLASCFVNDPAAAEDVAQDAWLGVLKGIGRFEGRAAFRTWLFRILTNTAKDRARRDGRLVQFSALVGSETAAADPAVDPALFQGPGDSEPGHWRSATPGRRANDPEQLLLKKDALAHARAAIAELPPAQRAVLLLRDLQGYSSEEVCNILDVPENGYRGVTFGPATTGMQAVRTMNRRNFTRAVIQSALGILTLAGLSRCSLAPAAPNEAGEAVDKLDKPLSEWRELLTPAQYSVLFQEGTELSRSSPLNNEKRAGVFICAACNLPLFRSDAKYESGTGWPSFFQPIEGALETKRDYRLILPRTEYHCIRCGGHQGHLFNDGPPPTGQRWCNNGVALEFAPDGQPLPSLRD